MHINWSATRESVLIRLTHYKKALQSFIGAEMFVQLVRRVSKKLAGLIFTAFTVKALFRIVSEQ